MSTPGIRTLWTLAVTIALHGAGHAQDPPRAANPARQLVAAERSALDRWIVADPQGYLDLYAPEVTYFDPNQAARVDGLDAMRTLFAPLEDVDLSSSEPHYDLIAPKVQRHGDVAVLTFNLVNYRKPEPDADAVPVARWNATDVYRLIGDQWRIIHSHWSHTRPD